MARTREEYIAEPLVDDNEGLKLFDITIMYRYEDGEIQEGLKLVKNLNKNLKIKTVLELGFGYGFTATLFQEAWNPDKHVIIEAHPEIYQRALEWKAQYPDKDITVINAFWQDVDFSNQQFDLVYDDTYELIFNENDEIDFEHIDYKIWANCYIDVTPEIQERLDNGSEMWMNGVFFEVNGKICFQPFRIK